MLKKWFTIAAALLTCGALTGYAYSIPDKTPNVFRLAQWRVAAEKGDPKAQFNLGSCYALGLGVKADIEQAAQWFRRSAEQGNAAAQCNLGTYYYGKKDYDRAVYWYRKAVEQGNADAQLWLGVCYALGNGVKKDYRMAAFF